jgi:hypothetical protein
MNQAANISNEKDLAADISQQKTYGALLAGIFAQKYRPAIPIGALSLTSSARLTYFVVPGAPIAGRIGPYEFIVRRRCINTCKSRARF